VHVNVTNHPTAAWTAHQLVESFPEETAPKYLLRDRDAIYGDVFVRRVKGLGKARSLSRLGRPGRIPSPSASSARFVGNASIASS
jgi:putative transposase